MDLFEGSRLITWYRARRRTERYWRRRWYFATFTLVGSAFWLVVAVFRQDWEYLWFQGPMILGSYWYMGGCALRMERYANTPDEIATEQSEIGAIGTIGTGSD